MPLNGTQLSYLKTADQRFRAHVAVFPAYTPTVTAPVVSDATGTAIAPRPILRCAPRLSVIAHSGTQVLYCRDSYNRGGAYVGNANVSAALNGGSAGSLADNGDGTFTYTAPSNGTGVAQINITVTNANGSKVGHAYVAYPKTTYDEVVSEVVSISGSLSQHGWKMTLRARGDVTDFTIGKRVLLHIEDTWAGTASTFGGYQYPEGVMVGYITETEYFLDGVGQSWLGVEIQSPWWMLNRIKVGEIWWGIQSEGGKLVLNGFAPADAVWHLLNAVTDFTAEHDVIVWSDPNTIDDFITEESDLATLVEDIMARVLGVTYCDRYGNLFCVPDPDVRADEYWGTPTSTYTLTPDFVRNYELQMLPYSMRKLVLAAFDSSKLGIYAMSENPTAQGEITTIRGLLCDSNLQLVDWAVAKRAQMNRPWFIEADHPLNHVLDLNNFVDAIFTAPAQAGAPTASAQVYTDSISYRPDISEGGWGGKIRYLKRTEGDGPAETGAVSGWGGTGSNWPGRGAYTGSAQYGSGLGGWVPPTGNPATWRYLFDFVNSGDAGFTANVTGQYAAGQGWSAVLYKGAYDWADSGTLVQVAKSFLSRTITGMHIYATLVSAPVPTNSNALAIGLANGDGTTAIRVFGNSTGGNSSVVWAGTVTASVVELYYDFHVDGTLSDPGSMVRSAILGGIGTSPFPGSPTGNF